jgi:hypothetical protein
MSKATTNAALQVENSFIFIGHPHAPRRNWNMTELNFDRPPKPISELAGHPDFPHCAVGEFVDIGGFTGVVVEVLNNSIKVTAPEGFTRRFNHYRLRELYGPPPPEPPPPEVPTPPETKESPPPEPREIQEPDFDRPVKSIREFFGRPDYPQCAVGQLVDIGGYVGVVVNIENHSLKVRSRQGTSRKYNAAVLPNLYSK